MKGEMIRSEVCKRPLRVRSFFRFIFPPRLHGAHTIWPWLNGLNDESLTIVFSCQAPPVFVLNVGLKMLLACFGMFAELLSLFANSGHCGVMNVLALLKNS